MFPADLPTLLGEVYNAFFVIGGLIGAVIAVFRSHKSYVEHRQELKETRAIVDELISATRAQDVALAEIKRKLTMNGKNTRNPGDLLGLICDKLGIELPE
jgi:hypothetical protein